MNGVNNGGICLSQNLPLTLWAQEGYDMSAFIHTMPRQKFNQAYNLLKIMHCSNSKTKRMWAPLK
jgi:hypothetical protein